MNFLPTTESQSFNWNSNEASILNSAKQILKLHPNICSWVTLYSTHTWWVELTSLCCSPSSLSFSSSSHQQFYYNSYFYHHKQGDQHKIVNFWIISFDSKDSIITKLWQWLWLWQDKNALQYCGDHRSSYGSELVHNSIWSVVVKVVFTDHGKTFVLKFCFMWITA